MGISNAVSGGIMLISFVYVMVMIPGLFEQNVTVNSAMSERAALDDTISRTKLTITDLGKVGDDIVEATLSNDGTTKLWKYEKFTAIITYDANVTGVRSRITEYPSYGGITASGPAGTWVMYSFDPDLDSIDPQMVNPGETFKIRLRNQHDFADNSVVLLTLSTDNGIIASRSEVL